MNFLDACKQGNIELAKKLYKPADLQTAFEISCSNGHLEIAKWLYSLGADIHAKHEYAFRHSCKNGQLEVAKWLYSLGVNINAENEYAFRHSCREDYFEVAKWLHSIDYTIITRCARKVNRLYDEIGFDDETKMLFRCIKQNVPFPEINKIDDIIIISLGHYNMISHLTKLSEQFSCINFDVVRGKVADLTINRTQVKSVRTV